MRVGPWGISVKRTLLTSRLQRIKSSLRPKGAIAYRFSSKLDEL